MKPFSPYAIHCLSRLLNGQQLTAEEIGKAHEADRPILNHLNGLKPRSRKEALGAALVVRGGKEETLKAITDADPAGPAPDPGEESRPRFDFDIRTVAQLDLEEFPREYLIEGVLVACQPCIVGGPKKALKTSIMVALALALAAGRPFLGQFNVAKAKRVLFLSGESGEATTQETFRRVAGNMGVSLAGVGDRLHIGFKLPALGNPEQMAALAEKIREVEAEVVVVDPLYLCLLSAGIDVDEKSLFQMGPLLATIARTCLDAGATPVLVHHFKKNRDSPEAPPELEDLAFAGVAEFARQWLLLGRRTAYAPGTGKHELWLVYGGSAGHGGAWALDVEEGIADETFSGRYWRTTLTGSGEARKAAVAEKAAKREEAQKTAKMTTAKSDAEQVVERLRKKGAPMSRTALREAMSISGGKINAAVLLAIDEGLIEEIDIQVPAGKNGAGARTWTGLQYVDRTVIPFSSSSDRHNREPGQNPDRTRTENPDRTNGEPGLGGPFRGPSPSGLYGPVGQYPDKSNQKLSGFSEGGPA